LRPKLFLNTFNTLGGSDVGTAGRLLWGFALLAVLAAAALAMLRHGIYGWTLFVLAPIVLGGAAAWITEAATAGRAARNGTLAVLFALLSLLLFAWEGAICIAMVLPLALPLGALGGWIVWSAGNTRRAARGGAAMLLLAAPGSLAWDSNARPDVFEVHSAIRIDAPPETVWKHVVSFSELPEPREWFFRAGVAYPMRARIDGSGVGAIRYCEFSTGPFVEPIESWDPPRLLQFRVTANPAPMHEWSPYAHVLPRHLHGYLVSKQGQFRLTRLPGQGTLLEGTTWYQHGLWPARYWSWWSGAIIHRIHLRVLEHIRTLAEREIMG
jgi:hypothetical protein